MERDEDKKKKQQNRRRQVEQVRASKWERKEMENETCSSVVESVGTAETERLAQVTTYGSVHCKHSACMGMGIQLRLISLSVECVVNCIFKPIVYVMQSSATHTNDMNETIMGLHLKNFERDHFSGIQKLSLILVLKSFASLFGNRISFLPNIFRCWLLSMTSSATHSFTIV